MILVDTGPLVALLNRNDPNHSRCTATAQSLPPDALLTTWAVFTEAMYMVGRAGGPDAQDRLWNLYNTRGLVIHDLTHAETDRSRELMTTYRDRPMDLADATLVAVAESLGHRRVFTLDGDFRIYRLADGSVLDVIG